MDDQDYHDLLKRYLKGDFTPEERTLLDAWYDSLEAGAQNLVSETDETILAKEKWAELQHELILPKPKSRRLWLYGAAASAAILILALLWIPENKPQNERYEISKAVKGPDTIEKFNNSGQVMKVVLADRSVVKLEPGAKIRYPEKFSETSREVVLEGQAFFVVTKDPTKPFIVYAGQVVTKVLGTSFNVDASRGGQDVTVAVKTGRVSVFSPKLTPKSTGTHDPETGGVVLTSNQQVVFMAKELRLVKMLVEEPDLILPPVEQPRFAFDNAPVDEIFKALEQSYGVVIVYDEALLSNCRITTSIENGNLYDKLKIICKLLNASYKIIDAQIVVTSEGC